MTGQDGLGARRGGDAENRSDDGQAIGFPDGGVADLEKLAAELDGEQYQARVVAHAGRRPYLHVRNRAAGVLTENVYADSTFYWWAWAERIAPVGEVATAAQIIMRVLRALDAR